MRYVVGLLVLLPALASAQPSPRSPETEALSLRVIQEINANIQCNANAIAGRQEIEKLQAELKELKEKLNAK